jgi:hypothetical protein
MVLFTAWMGFKSLAGIAKPFFIKKMYNQMGELFLPSDLKNRGG